MTPDTSLQKILFILNGTPSEKYRVHNYLKYFKAGGSAMDYRVITHKSSAYPWLVWLNETIFYARVLFSAPGYQRIFIQKRLFPSAVLKILARINPWIIYDFDDAVYARRSWQAQAPATKNRRFESTMRHVHTIIAGNDYLAEKARATGFTGPLHILPTAVDINKFTPVPRAPDTRKPIVIGWFGLSDNLFYCDFIKPVLAAIGKKYGDRVIFRIVSDKAMEFPGITLQFKPWAEEDEPADIAGFDIGIMPLIDDEWSRGKCGWKALLYMAMGKPAVISPVGFNAKILQNGVHGFFAESSDSWIGAISRLIDDPAMRQTFGEAARTHIVRNFSLPAYAAEFYSCVFGKAL